MDISLFLSKFLGLYFIIISLALLAHVRQIRAIFIDIMDNPSLLFVTGFMALIMGLLLVLSHNIWTYDWKVIITIIGWTTLLKGILRVLFPRLGVKLNKKWVQSTFPYYITALLTLGVGSFLCYKGWSLDFIY